jgi:uncharacterized protein (DUF1330 family)
MFFELMVGLHVTDNAEYSQYRTGIAPLLQEAGGEFRYDFEVARTLKNEADHEINRVFLLRFPDRAAKERFFADPRYREIRRRFFPQAVGGLTIIAECSG